nr:signal peptidase I [uncultured Acetatifactor sp.]
MIDEIESISHPSKRKGRKVFPALCSMLGTLILLGVIAAFLPLTVPRLMGYGIYEVVSGSMEPEIPVGSVIYVKAAQPDTVEAGDIIAFYKDESVITHRVEENRYVEGEFITKGDANREEDMEPVPYNSVMGKVERHIPALGIVLTLLASNTGKLYAVLLAVCGVMFHMLAGILRNRERD